MPGDYPDWTDLVHLVGTDIMLAIDMQASYIMMPVDIQAQFLTLDINIKAQDADIDINIAAQDADINVNLAAQDADIDINLEAQSVGIYLQPAWAALQSTDFIVTGSRNSRDFGESFSAGRTAALTEVLYVTDISWFMYPDAEEASNRPLYCVVALHDAFLDADLIRIGGVGGGSIAFSKPIRCMPNRTINIRCYNYSNVECTCGATMNGFSVL